MGCVCSSGSQRRSSNASDDECSSNLDLAISNHRSRPCDAWFRRTASFPDCRRHRSKKNRHCVSELALAMHKTECTAAAVIGMSAGIFLTQTRVNEIIGQAKAEGSVIKAIDGHLYIDYKHVGRVPPGVRIKT